MGAAVGVLDEDAFPALGGVGGAYSGSSEPRSRGALGALTSDRAYDAAAARADAHLDAYAYGTNRRDDAEVSSQFGRMRRLGPRR